MTEIRANVDDFDLRRHAVVEASAGTGKTFTIERLVFRLLTEEKIPLESILVVTFTEKATGELKARLRGMLQKELNASSDHAPCLQAALEQFDQASIFTIHAFCQRVLQEHALEQGQELRVQHVSDVDLLKTLLREVQRKHWRSQFGAQLKRVLDAAPYNRASAEKWENTVLDIAARYKPRAGHQLRPAALKEWWRRLDEAEFNCTGQLEVFTVDMLHHLLREYKDQRGLQSFDDMIALVEESLDPQRNPEAPSFLATLRARFQCGIVDEFQDTDPLQWRIFERIFLASESSRLFVVGDPKQAIYGFRNSDLQAYLHAAEAMRTQYAAREYALPINWRSEQCLLDALNCLFMDGEWFPPELGVRYHLVRAPDPDQALSCLESDQSKRAALTIVDLTATETVKAAKKRHARFVVHEIDRLLHGAEGRPLFSIVRKGAAPRPLSAGDICLLVGSRNEAQPLIEALDFAGIPYNVYKQSGLWQTEEAMHLEMLLQTLARPDDRAAFRKALLTCFFRVSPAELVRGPDVAAEHPARQLYQTWLGMVEHRAWSALCRSLLEDTGLLFLDADARAQRRVAILRHLFAALEQAGHELNLDLLAMLAWMQKLRQRRETGDADLVPVETDQAKVQIMTIHASKGLEFPVVFLAGGFTHPPDVPIGQRKYRDDEGRIVFDLKPDADAGHRFKMERLSEERRLLYVALTRAIFKLYVPKITLPKGSARYLGPVGTILLPALKRAYPDKLGPLVAETTTPPLFQPLPQRRVIPAKPAAVTAAASITIDGSLFPPPDTSVVKRRVVVRSFTSMARHHLSQLGEGASFGEQLPRAEDETATLVDIEDPLRGPVFGDMVHKVFENIDFAEVGRAGSAAELCLPGAHARKCLDQAIQPDLGQLRTRTPFDQLMEAARRQIALLVWQTLKTPLAALGGPLCDVRDGDRLHEVEFLFPERPGEPVPANKHFEEGFVTGYMDLLLRRDERYFLLDWKTNLLPGYTREQIDRNMAESDYHRQYRLYLNAARRWLERRLGPSFDWAKGFGGVYYLYVRGMNGRDESTGVFFHCPTDRDLDLTLALRE